MAQSVLWCDRVLNVGSEEGGALYHLVTFSHFASHMDET